ncbi:hypothetical protein IKQ65_00630 [Candidatus Saccharibacteria bacterium]|nr:hypothetical protein [Candidatus Saccharibacteria bacterium]MBR6961157.1 hypothetical protein [Candidatus Saccharibacteria bacterium]
MAKRKMRRSYEPMRRRMRLFWIVMLFFLVLLVVLDVIVVLSNRVRRNNALDAEVDYSKISLNGLFLGEEPEREVRDNIIVDPNYSYSWNNILFALDSEGRISRLGFFTTTDGASFDDVSLRYRGYPLATISDFATYFGYTRITNFGHYRYLTYADLRYGIDITMMGGKLYNVEIYKK